MSEPSANEERFVSTTGLARGVSEPKWKLPFLLQKVLLFLGGGVRQVQGTRGDRSLIKDDEGTWTGKEWWGRDGNEDEEEEHWQCDQTAKLFFQYLPLYNNKHLPNSIKNLPN